MMYSSRRREAPSMSLSISSSFCLAMFRKIGFWERYSGSMMMVALLDVRLKTCAS